MLRLLHCQPSYTESARPRNMPQDYFTASHAFADQCVTKVAQTLKGACQWAESFSQQLEDATSTVPTYDLTRICFKQQCQSMQLVLQMMRNLSCRSSGVPTQHQGAVSNLDVAAMEMSPYGSSCFRSMYCLVFNTNISKNHRDASLRPLPSTSAFILTCTLHQHNSGLHCPTHTHH